MSKVKPLRIRIYRSMIYVVAVFLVLAAIVVSVARVMLHDLGKYRAVVEQQVSRLLDQKVSIQGFDARLEGMTPVLIFKNVELLHSQSGRKLAKFSEARIGIAVVASVREHRLVPAEITIDGIHIIVTRSKSNSLSVQGFKVSQAESPGPAASDNQLAKWLFGYSDISLENSAITWRDNLLAKHYEFNDVNLHLANRGMRHVLTGRVQVPKELGRDVKFSADINGETLDPNGWDGKFFLQAYSVNLQQWEQFQPKWDNARLKEGQVDLQLWGSWQQNRLSKLSGEISAYDLLLQEQKNKQVEFKLIAGMFDWQRKQQDWEVKVKNLQIIHQGSVWPKTDMTIFYSKADEDTYQVTADYLRLEDIHQLTRVFGGMPVKFQKAIDGIQASGDISDLKAKIFIQQDRLRDFVASAYFKNLSTSAWERFPAIQGFQGKLVGTLEHGELEIDNQFSTLYFPKLFRRAFSLHKLKTELRWSHNQYGWMLSASDVVAETAEVKTSSNVYLHVPANGASPYLDLQVQFWDGDARFANTYYPVGIMHKNLVDWLDKGIVAGDVSFGGAVFSGRLKEFPFRQQQGAFQVQFYADNVELNYQPGWPHLTQARVDASFTGEGMHIKGLKARLLKQTVSDDVDVSIKDFLQPELQVKARAAGPTHEVFEFLTQSPIAPDGRQFVDTITSQGNSTLNLDLYVPLNKKVSALRPLHYRGNVALKNNQFLLLDRKIDVKEVNGAINFNEMGLTAKNIQASVFNEPASISVYTQDFKEARPIQVVAEGKVDTALLAKRFEIPALQRFSGQTGWQGAFTLPYSRSGRQVSTRLAITSDLKNVAIDLPAPLGKQGDETAGFVMSVEFRKQQPGRIGIQYDDLVQVNLGLKLKQGQTVVSKGAVHFGEAMPPLPGSDRFEVSGELTGLPLDDWSKVLSQDLSTSKGKRQQEAEWKSPPVYLAMDRLQLVLQDDAPETAEAPSKTGLDILPQQWPLLNGYINQLEINQNKIGKVSLETERDRYGFNFKQIQLKTPLTTVEASGGWHYRRDHDTYLDITMNSSDLGAQLAQWGFAAIIKGGKVKDSQMQVRWADNPFGFAFAKLNGDMSAIIDDGNIVEVDPGAGRLFGLLSLSALPRRLFLDFADMQSGFSFDTVRGNFELKNGNATTKNLTVDSTLAKVVVDGRTGLAQKDYDLNVLVIPNISGTAPLPAWVVWGPQVGAVLLFFKQLFGQEFDKSVARAYHITGSWEKPTIKKVKSPGNEKSE